MKTFVMGGTGATGKHLVQQLLNMGSEVVAVVRSPDRVPSAWKNDPRVTLVETSISKASSDEMTRYLWGCQSAASCLGHNVSTKGIFGKPRRLVADTVRLTARWPVQSRGHSFSF
jgi:nucleoside-diphosphate-sugar epimerase